MEIQRHFVDSNGNPFVAIFDSEPQSAAYVPPEGAIEVPDRPSTDHHWQGGEWVYVEPEPPPPPTQDELFPPLEPWRFWTVIELPGSIGEDNLRNAVATHPDPVFRAFAKARLNNPPSGRYYRSDPMFANAELQAELGIDSAGIDALWTQGLALAMPT